ncbi:MAG: metal-sensing transcriptional repressor [Candidatus Moranbacteria bacterium]|nr:metal-sensing transcriptional repressor [Candidatus Moranbacteria bacterium]
MAHVHHANREKVLLNYKKAKGLLEKLISMTKEEAYCVDLMKQNLAAVGLLRSAHQMLLEDHLNSCFRGAMEAGTEKKKQEMIGEILTVTRLSNK